MDDHCIIRVMHADTAFCNSVWIILVSSSWRGGACGQWSSSLASTTFPPFYYLLSLIFMPVLSESQRSLSICYSFEFGFFFFLLFVLFRIIYKIKILFNFNLVQFFHLLSLVHIFLITICFIWDNFSNLFFHNFIFRFFFDQIWFSFFSFLYFSLWQVF
jgi:hypothetical protein